MNHEPEGPPIKAITEWLRRSNTARADPSLAASSSGREKGVVHSRVTLRRPMSRTTGADGAGIVSASTR
jgi:hypothetical protein